MSVSKQDTSSRPTPKVIARSCPVGELSQLPLARPRGSSISNQSLIRSTSEPFREAHDRRTSRASRSRSHSPSWTKPGDKLRVLTEVEDDMNSSLSPAPSSASTRSSDKHRPSRPRSRAEKASRRKSVSSVQSEDYSRTRERVYQAVGTVLGTANGVARDVLSAGVDLLQFAPIPALGIAGSILVSIWQAIETIEANDSSCLRLAERCAETLLAVHHLVSPDVDIELAEPVQRLEEAFMQIQDILERQSQRPFLHRYLKREEMRRSIGYCETSLGDALGLFMIKIQLHTLRAVNRARERRRSQVNSIETSMYTARASTYLSQSGGLDDVQALPAPYFARQRDVGCDASSASLTFALSSAVHYPDTLSTPEADDAFEREMLENEAIALKRLSDIMSDLSVSSWTVTECGTEGAYMDPDENPFISPLPARASHIAPWDSPIKVDSPLPLSIVEPSSASEPTYFCADEASPTSAEGDQRFHADVLDGQRFEPPEAPLTSDSAALAETGTQGTDDLEGAPSPIWPPLVPASQEQDNGVLGFRARCMGFGAAIHPDMIGTLLEINPILAYQSQYPVTGRKHLVWNMLCPSFEACMSTDPTRRWFEERIEPATFPPVTHLYLISARFPWSVLVTASSIEFGVSCGDLTGALSGVLQSHLPPSMWGEKGDPQRKALKQSYRANRSNEAGSPGHKLGDGMRFVDVLGAAVTFSGLYPLCEGEGGPPVPGVLAVLCT